MLDLWSLDGPPHTEVLPDARSTWVMKFYVILPALWWDDPHPAIRILGFYIPLNTTVISDVLDVVEVSNVEYKAKMREMDLP